MIDINIILILYSYLYSYLINKSSSSSSIIVPKATRTFKPAYWCVVPFLVGIFLAIIGFNGRSLFLVLCLWAIISEWKRQHSLSSTGSDLKRCTQIFWRSSGAILLFADRVSKSFAIITPCVLKIVRTVSTVDAGSTVIFCCSVASSSVIWSLFDPNDAPLRSLVWQGKQTLSGGTSGDSTSSSV